MLNKGYRVVMKLTRKKLAWISLYLLLSLLLAVFVVVNTEVRAKLVDSLLVKSPSISVVTMYFLCNLLVFFMTTYGLPAAMAYMASHISEYFRLHTSVQIQEKKGRIPYHFHEDQAINDRFEMIKDTPEMTWSYLKGFITIASMLISLSGIFIILAQMGWLISLALFLVFIPVFYLSIKAGTTYFDTWKKTSQLRRYSDYLRDVLLDKQYAQEKILYGFSVFFIERWEKGYSDVRKLSLKEEIRGAKKMLTSNFLLCIYVIILFIVMIYLLQAGRISMGVVVSVISIVPMLFTNIVNGISNEVNSIVRAKGSLDALAQFLEFEEEQGAFDLPAENIDFSVIEFVNVSFRYSNTDRWILKDLSLRIEKGKHYALVGENGTGKSTIIKLLLRLYPLSDGDIRIDGRSIHDLTQSEVRGLFAALFQDFQKYYTTVEENIGIGDIHSMQEPCRANEAARAAKMHERIIKMPNGYKTLLGTMIDGGIDISGGEWQKLNIARLLMSPCPMIILDEPTAAMDPLFERELYEDFGSIMKNRTTLSISHRLGACRQADCIYFLSDGTITEKGTHDELLKLGQKYSRMYTTQKAMYERGVQSV